MAALIAPSRRGGWLAGGAAFLAFLAESSIRLTAQGVNQDELFQAPAAFSWVGRPARIYSALSIGHIPVLNMSYNGALKTAFFGLWLRLSRAHFTVASWRFTGILIVAVGLLAFWLRKYVRLAS